MTSLDKQDRRVTKTRQEIKEAFIALMQEKGFDALTVRDLTERANINRTTFYKHFLDKYDLLDRYEQEIFDRIEAIIEQAPASALHDWFEQHTIASIVQVYEIFHEEKSLMKILLGPNGDSTFQEKIRLLLTRSIHARLADQIDPAALHFPLELMVMYVSSAHVGIIRYWLENDIPYSPEQLARLLLQIVTQGPYRASGLERLLAR